jgi:hypothetical protein
LLLAAVACEPQVGADYGGEPMLSIRGTVQLTDPSQTDLVPALSFPAPNGDIVLMDVQVRGEFPSRFRLDVLEPPPDAVLFPNNVLADGPRPGVAGQLAIGQVVVVPREHPGVLRVTESWDPMECNDDERSCSHERERCVDGACLRRTEQCRQEACELVRSSGEPVEKVASGKWHWECGPETCMAMLQQCAADNECHREFHACSRDRDIRGTNYQICEVLAESGDPAGAAFANLDEAVVGYTVIYSTVDQPSTLGDLKAGYHLVRRLEPEDPQAWVDGVVCEQEAAVTATKRYNQEHATHHVVGQVLDDTAAADIDRLAAELAEDCPETARQELVVNPMEQQLNLKMGPREASP